MTFHFESTPKQTLRELHDAEALHKYQLQQAGGLPWQEYKQEWNKRAAKTMQERKEKDENTGYLSWRDNLKANINKEDEEEEEENDEYPGYLSGWDKLKDDIIQEE